MSEFPPIHPSSPNSQQEKQNTFTPREGLGNVLDLLEMGEKYSFLEDFYDFLQSEKGLQLKNLIHEEKNASIRNHLLDLKIKTKDSFEEYSKDLKNIRKIVACTMVVRIIDELLNNISQKVEENPSSLVTDANDSERVITKGDEQKNTSFSEGNEALSQEELQKEIMDFIVDPINNRLDGIYLSGILKNSVYRESAKEFLIQKREEIENKYKAFIQTQVFLSQKDSTKIKDVTDLFGVLLTLSESKVNFHVTTSPLLTVPFTANSADNEKVADVDTIASNSGNSLKEESVTSLGGVSTLDTPNAALIASHEHENEIKIEEVFQVLFHEDLDKVFLDFDALTSKLASLKEQNLSEVIQKNYQSVADSTKKSFQYRIENLGKNEEVFPFDPLGIDEEKRKLEILLAHVVRLFPDTTITQDAPVTTLAEEAALDGAVPVGLGEIAPIHTVPTSPASEEVKNIFVREGEENGGFQSAVIRSAKAFQSRLLQRVKDFSSTTVTSFSSHLLQMRQKMTPRLKSSLDLSEEKPIEKSEAYTSLHDEGKEELSEHQVIKNEIIPDDIKEKSLPRSFAEIDKILGLRPQPERSFEAKNAIKKIGEKWVNIHEKYDKLDKKTKLALSLSLLAVGLGGVALSAAPLVATATVGKVVLRGFGATSFGAGATKLVKNKGYVTSEKKARAIGLAAGVALFLVGTYGTETFTWIKDHSEGLFQGVPQNLSEKDIVIGKSSTPITVEAPSAPSIKIPVESVISQPPHVTSSLEAIVTHSILSVSPGDTLTKLLSSEEVLRQIAGDKFDQLSSFGKKNLIANLLGNLSEEDLKSVGVMSGNADLITLEDRIDVEKLANLAKKIQFSLKEDGNDISIIERALLFKK